MSHKTTRTHLRRAVYHTRQTLIGFGVELLWIARVQGYLLRGVLAALVHTLQRRKSAQSAAHPLRDDLSAGERIAEHVTDFIGSWPYIIGQSVFLATWFALNVLPFVGHWDPWPWMGANIIMSTLAAFATSFVLIAQKVGSRRDEKLWNMMVTVLQHVEKIAEADHAEHGRLLREVHSHVYCDGHTTIESASAQAAQAVQADQPSGEASSNS